MIKRFILHILANAVALYIIVNVMEGSFMVTGSWKGLLIAGLFFGILNGFIKPLIKIITLPFVFITAGLFTLVINMFLVWFAKYALDVLQFKDVAILVEGGWVTYLYVGIIMAFANMIIHWLVKN
ncbi:phage holin family protein [Patescibacteria group bacterium]|nr:phage holin family protein [Patescibacteria group bacterium]MBU1682569.1 phage holin family protein [Patescibacteria group bacterium]